MTVPQDIAVVHLLRAANPPEAFLRFLDSYRRAAEPTPHELLVIFKGFAGTDDAWALDALRGTAFRRIDWPDTGFDLGPYLHVGRTEPHRLFCFLNSFSRILADEWLTKLVAALEYQPRAGAVGASGNWQSVFEELPFPNPHLRTNAFLIAGDVLRRLDVWPMHDKLDCYRFESGRRGLTQQLLALGLETYVVDRDGRAWPREEWNRSETFWSGEQRNLLVADGRTDDYAHGDRRTRAKKTATAWQPPRMRPIRWLRERLGLCRRKPLMTS